DTDGGLRADVPGIVLMASRGNYWIHCAFENSRIEQIPDAGRPEQILRGSAMIGPGQIVVVAREIPAKLVVQGESGADAVGVLEKEPPGLGQLVEVVRLHGVEVLTGLRVVGKLAADAGNASR